MTMNKRNIVVGAVCLALVGFIVYKANQVDKPTFTPPEVTIGPIVSNTVEVKDEIITLPEIVVVGEVSPEAKTPFRHGTKLCQLWEDVGLASVADLDGTAETTCSGDTCFLLVHDSGMPAYLVMAAWLSEASKAGHDPRIDNVELSVFTFEKGKETSDVIYFPERDVFEAY
jgi:hypothetical protein